MKSKSFIILWISIFVLRLLQPEWVEAASQIYLPFTNTDALFNFSAYTNASAPQSSLVFGSDGVTLFGTTVYGGKNKLGCIFSVSDNDTGFTILHSFSTDASDGSMSYSTLPASSSHVVKDGNLGGLLLSLDGWLYGTTPTGGTNNEGTVYRIAQDGSDFQVLHSFSADDSYPAAPVIQGSDGALYGTCYDAQPPGGGTGGAIFKLNTDGSGYAVLGYTTNAYIISGLVQGNDGALYGTANLGAGILVFSASTNGNTCALLYTNTTVLYSAGTLVQAASGFLFGTTDQGGASNYGVVFMINTNGSGFQIVHSFNNGTMTNDGVYPESGLISAGGFFYGTTQQNASNGAEGGSIYQIAQNGSNYNQVYSFSPNIYSAYAEYLSIAAPTAGLFQGNTGAIFGTFQSGLNGPGGVYGLLINPPMNITPVSGLSGGQVTVTWPSWAVSFTLMSTTNLASGPWVTVTNGTPVVGVQLPATNGSMYYKLVSP